jgi:hypothetical protein
MKASSLIASVAVVLSVSLLPATVSAKDEVKTTVSQCTQNCGIKHKNCLKAGKVSAETCKLSLNQCQNEICGKLGTQQSPTSPAAGSPKK